METKEVVRYGDRNVPLVITEIADAEAITEAKECASEVEQFKIDYSLVEEYRKLGLYPQAKVARKEAEEKAQKAKKEARTQILKKLGFRLLSENEIIKIGRHYIRIATNTNGFRWNARGGFGGILDGFAGENRTSCNPWINLNYMEGELIPLRVAQSLTALKPLFSEVYIASPGNAQKSLEREITHRYQDPVAVGIAGDCTALLARWGDYPKFLDSPPVPIDEQPISPRSILWKLDESLGRLFGQKRQEQE